MQTSLSDSDLFHGRFAERSRRAQTFVLPIAPTAKGRARFARGHAWTPKKTQYAEEAIADMLRDEGAWLYERNVPLRVTLTFTVERKKSTPGRRDWPIVRPDLDQYVKLVLDAGNEVIWVDDAQIVSLTGIKLYGPTANTQIEVMPL
jgi:Holliday junction resolvase RusA-like endonuclease